ncbi:glycosyl transferase family 90-domain-containing protein [Mycena pura]|uniref:Glycosyl transferase family 90-domain-containing protein n=1 Tax=Mycena pura TaxID=153505 RepID=A0AAD6YEZ2_9AGAR|nr:glycosyl transferase family 90-domain-containing protein [Mycena pura]
MFGSRYTRLPTHPDGTTGGVRNGGYTSHWRRWLAVCALLVLVVLGIFFYVRADVDPETPPPLTLAPQELKTPVDELFTRQSSTLDQAAARYSLRNGRLPPKGYDRWFRYATAQGCLIDEYEQIYTDFQPFHQLASTDKGYFRRMAGSIWDLARGQNLGMKTFRVRKGSVEVDEWSENFYGEWMDMLRDMSEWLPPFDLVLNHRDEPRVSFDVRQPDALQAALAPSDTTPFDNTPQPTSKWYTDEHHCLVLSAPKGFFEYANNASSFLSYSASSQFTTDLYPVFSQNKIYPCFSDILFPSNVSSDAEYLADWRGQSTGGWISGNNYISFPRFKVVELSQQHPALIDARITALYEYFCRTELGCDKDELKEKYNITGENAPREDVYQYQYVLDVDGNAFSGRFLGLLKSGSLVFKSTLFTEYFSQWLRPFVHYIPVRADLADLLQRIEWARANPLEAKRIQEAGKEVAERVITDAQNDCYFALALLEWAGLQGL